MLLSEIPFFITQYIPDSSSFDSYPEDVRNVIYKDAKRRAVSKKIQSGKIGIESHQYTIEKDIKVHDFASIVLETIRETPNMTSITFYSIINTKVFHLGDILRYDTISKLSKVLQSLLRNKFTITISHITGRCIVSADYYKTRQIGMYISSNNCDCLIQCFYYLTQKHIRHMRGITDIQVLEKVFDIKVDVYRDNRHIEYSRRNHIVTDDEIIVHGDGSSKYKLLYKENHYDIIVEKYDAKDCHSSITGDFIGYKKYLSTNMTRLSLNVMYSMNPTPITLPVYYFFYRETVLDSTIIVYKTDEKFTLRNTTTCSDEEKFVMYLFTESHTIPENAYLIGYFDNNFLLSIANRFRVSISNIEFHHDTSILSANIGKYKVKNPKHIIDISEKGDKKLYELYKNSKEMVERITHIDIDMCNTFEDVAYSAFINTLEPNTLSSLNDTLDRFVRKAFIDRAMDYQHAVDTQAYPIGKATSTDHYVPRKLGVYNVTILSQHDVIIPKCHKNGDLDWDYRGMQNRVLTSIEIEHGYRHQCVFRVKNGIYWKRSSKHILDTYPLFSHALINKLIDSVVHHNVDIKLCRSVSDVESFFSRTKNKTQRLRRIYNDIYIAEGDVDRESTIPAIYGILIHSYLRSFNCVSCKVKK